MILMKIHFKKLSGMLFLLLCFFIPVNINADSPAQSSSDKIRTIVTKPFTDLPSDFFDATQWPRIPCAPQFGQNTSRLVYTGIQAMPTAFDDWRASPTMRLGSLAEDSNPNRIGKLNVEGLFDEIKKGSEHSQK
jgi:hypothetical protein